VRKKDREIQGDRKTEGQIDREKEREREREREE
jgi:hypothetical protein